MRMDQCLLLSNFFLTASLMVNLFNVSITTTTLLYFQEHEVQSDYSMNNSYMNDTLYHQQASQVSGFEL